MSSVSFVIHNIFNFICSEAQGEISFVLQKVMITGRLLKSGFLNPGLTRNSKQIFQELFL